MSSQNPFLGAEQRKEVTIFDANVKTGGLVFGTWEPLCETVAVRLKPDGSI